MTEHDLKDWALTCALAFNAPPDNQVIVKASTVLAIDLERRTHDPAPRRRPAMQWTTERPTQPGLYYFQNSKMQWEFSDLAVQVVDVRAYKNRPGLNCTALGGLMDFSCDVARAPDGRWAGPLPEPYDGP